MQLNVSSNRVAIGPSLRARIERRLEAALIRLRRWIQRATVHLEAPNRLRGANVAYTVSGGH